MTKNCIFTAEEFDTIIYALADRQTAMFRDYEEYKKGGNKEAMMDCLDEMRKAQELRDKLSEMERKDFLRAASDAMSEIVCEKGERDGDIFRVWLSDLNGLCDISGHTDIVCAHLGEDGKLTFQINTPVDNSSIFVYLEELPYSVATKTIKRFNEIISSL